MRLFRRMCPLVFIALLGLGICLEASEAFASDCAVTDSGDNGPGTLRNCIDNVATDDGDIVTVPAMTISLTSGELWIDRALVIRGESAGTSIIDGGANALNRIFHISLSGSKRVEIRDLTIRGASVKDSGAGIYASGLGELAIFDSVIRKNYASPTATGVLQGGGGIFAAGEIRLSLVNSEVLENRIDGETTGAGIISTHELTVDNSLIYANDASDTVNGVGGIWSSGIAEVRQSTFEFNSGKSGGGGFFTGANFSKVAFLDNIAILKGGGLSVGNGCRFTDVYFARNRVTQGFGGGLYTYGVDNSLRNATFEGNIAQDGGEAFVGDGGGIYNSGNFTAENLTLFGNSATGSGGGVFNGLGFFSLTHGTVSSNIADSDAGGAVPGDGGGLYVYQDSFVTISNSIVAGNSDLLGLSDDCANQGSLRMVGNNILENDSGCPYEVIDAGVTANQPPLLSGDLSENGGPALGRMGMYPTRTLALLEGSPAIDAADATICAGYAFDQRGVARPQGNQCDIGAYEWSTSAMVEASPTPAPGPGGDLSNGGCAIVARPHLGGMGILWPGIGLLATLFWQRSRIHSDLR